MTLPQELSFPWNGIYVPSSGNSAAKGKYSADVWSMWANLLCGYDYSAELCPGILPWYLNGLVATLPGGSVVTIDTGSAVLLGRRYLNDAALSFNIPAPAAAQRRERIVLQCDWTTQIIRLVRKTSIEGVMTYPALVQTYGTIWEIYICSYIAWPVGDPHYPLSNLTDERVICRLPFSSMRWRQGGGPVWYTPDTEDWLLQGANVYRPGATLWALGNTRVTFGAGSQHEHLILTDKFVGFFGNTQGALCFLSCGADIATEMPMYGYVDISLGAFTGTPDLDFHLYTPTPVVGDTVFGFTYLVIGPPQK
jgi:hypothetical protein